MTPIVRSLLGVTSALALQVSLTGFNTALAQLKPTPPAAAEEPGEEKEPIILLEEAAKDDAYFKFDYGVPTSPALTLAGLSPDKTTTSSSLKQFVISLPTFLGSEDNGQAIALDFAPASLFTGDLDDAAFSDYVKGNAGWRGILNRTRLGLALSQGNDNTDASKRVPSRLAAGVSVSLLNASDPLMTRGEDGKGYLLSCLEAQSPRAYAILESDLQATANMPGFKEAYPGLSDAERAKLTTIDTRGGQIVLAMEEQAERASDTTLSTADRQAAEKKLSELAKEERELAALKKKLLDLMVKTDEGGVLAKEIKACGLEASLRAESAMDLDIGIGGLWRGTPGELGDFNDAGAAAWVAFRMPIDRIFERGKDGTPTIKAAWMVSASGRFSSEEYLATKDTTTPEFRADVSEAWIGLERVLPDLRFSAHYGYRDIRASDTVGKAFESSSDRYLVAAKIRLGKDDDGLWLNLSYGNANGATADKDDHTALISLSYSPTG